MSSIPVRLAAGVFASCSVAAAIGQTVTPPPLPPGSSRVRVDAGLQEPERKRYVRAHHHKLHHKRDYTRDDSAPGRQPGDRTDSPRGGHNRK